MARELSDKAKREQILGIHQSEDVEAFREWTKDQARSTAQTMGIELTDAHWEVIDFLRVHYQNVAEDLPPAHEFSQTLNERFEDQGGLRYLYKLFPEGPLMQGGKIAGIAVPADTSNQSFGSVH